MNHIINALATDMTTNFRDYMSSAGYEPSDELVEALANEFSRIAARDMKNDSSAELDSFITALAYAADRF